MSNDPTWFDEAGDELEDNEFPEGDRSADDETETQPCPQCGAEIYEDAVCCPICGTYVTHQASVWGGRPRWWIVLGLLGLIAAALVLAGLFPR